MACLWGKMTIPQERGVERRLHAAAKPRLFPIKSQPPTREDACHAWTTRITADEPIVGIPSGDAVFGEHSCHVQFEDFLGRGNDSPA
jgi:hypothetical protein